MLVTLLSACDAEQGPEGRGAIVVYSAGPRPLAEYVCEAFTRETGIPTQLFVATTGQLMAKLEAEKFNPRADVVILASRLAAEHLKREGRLLPYRPAWLADELTYPHWHDPDGTYLATSAAAVGLAVRTDKFRPDLDWRDFFDGRFDGIAVMPSPSRSGAASDYVLGYALGPGGDPWADFRAIRQHGMEIAGANSQAITNVLIGSHQAVFAAADYLILREVARGEPIVMHYPASGVPVVQRPIAILAHTPRRETAERFVDTYFSPAVQAEIGALHLMPAVRGTPVSPERAQLGDPVEWPMDLDRAMREQTSVLRRFQYEIERAVVVR
jgi:iron(III) transport system substrate-binding protein